MENTYYEWKHDFNYAAPENIVIPEAWNAYTLFGSRTIRKKLPPIQLSFKEETVLSDSIPSKKLMLFFSKKLVSFLNKNYSPRLLQSFPIEININSIGKIVDSYSVINILNKQDVIDRNKSELDINSYGEINQIKRLIIKEEVFENHDFFRLEGYASLLICSQAFVNKLIEMGFNGMKFIPVGGQRI